MPNNPPPLDDEVGVDSKIEEGVSRAARVRHEFQPTRARCRVERHSRLAELDFEIEMTDLNTG